MPIYEYECQNCSKNFEIIVTNQEEIISCPHCCSTKVKKLISLAHFRKADHWEQDMQRGLAMSKEFDEAQAEQKKRLL
jgi:putative FmdB family regulatory protein